MVRIMLANKWVWLESCLLMSGYGQSHEVLRMAESGAIWNTTMDLTTTLPSESSTRL